MIQLKNQIHFCDIYEEVEDCFKEDKPKFIKLFEEYINVKVLIPQTFLMLITLRLVTQERFSFFNANRINYSKNTWFV